MEETKPINHFRAGLLIAAFMVVFSLIMNLVGQGNASSLGWLGNLAFIGALIYFINKYGKANNNTPSFGELFSYGFKITSIVTLIMIIFLVIFFVSFPEHKATMLEAVTTEMEGQVDTRKITESQADMMINQYDKNFILLTGGSALFMYLVMGAIGSLIGAAITKKEPRTPFDQQIR
ncbi:MAG: DUF4199 domain-containing protein [Chitinophagaceae bacterium]